MEHLIDVALRKALELDAEYCDVRFYKGVEESLRYVNGRLIDASRNTITGIGVRIIHKGALGFSSTTILTEDSVRRCVEEAFNMAKAMIGKGEEIKLKETKVVKDNVIRKVAKDPFQADLKDKVELCVDAYKSALAVVKGSVTSRFGAVKIERIFADTVGAYIREDITLTGLSCFITVSSEGRISLGLDYAGGSLGLELFKGKNSPEEIGRRAAIMARDKIKARGVTPGKYRVILGPEATGVLVHESFGHLSEADHVLEGASPLKGRLGEKLAAECVTIVDEGEPAYGGFLIRYDDEGVRTRRVEIVKNGVLREYLHSRETAFKLNANLTGNGRAQNFNFDPIVRMRNTFIEKGDYKLEELLEELKDGLYIDREFGGHCDLSGTFMFRNIKVYKVENGEIKEPLRDVSITGSILELLKNIEAVGKDVKIISGPFGACGKGEQWVYVGLGGPHILVKNVTVGGAR